MKGLLLKDWYMAAKYCRAYLLIVVVFLAASIWSDNNLFFVVYPVLVSSLVPVTLISYDERCKWSTYSGVLPYSKKQIVVGKYIVAAVAALAGVLLTGISQIARAVYLGQTISAETFALLPILLFCGIVAPCILLPFIFRFGSEKGRILYYVLIVAVCAAGGALSASGGAIAVSLSPGLLPLVLVGAGIAVFFLSMYLSIYFYGRKEC